VTAVGEQNRSIERRQTSLTVESLLLDTDPDVSIVLCITMYVNMAVVDQDQLTPAAL
jgi:hypothetical protein